MFDALRRFMDDLAADPRRAAAPEDDVRLSVAALLYHVIAVDGRITARENSRLFELLEDRYGLGRADTAELVERAKEAELEAVDLYRFTSVLKHRLDAASRREIVALLWELVFADGRVDEFEDNVVWRVSELLGVPSRERMTLKQRVAREQP